jgi:choline dehydrogenase
MADWDYIVIGAGSSGCAVAGRLSEDAGSKVLLLEAGGPDASLWIKIPAGFMKILVAESKYIWGFMSEPDEGSGGLPLPILRGKTLGGSSSVNGMMYVRGQRQDYDGWAQSGARGWSYEDVLPYFRKLENIEGYGDDRGRDGPMHLSTLQPDPAAAQFLQAAAAEGIRQNPDYNGWDQEGVGRFQTSMRRGRRWSAADGYLRPAMQRPNLKVQTHAQVLGLILEGKRCVGVRYRLDGQAREARVNREVVLSAGAVQSPQILELSGVGRPELLRAHGVEVRVAAPSVGENHYDHYGVNFSWRLKEVVTFNERSHGLRMAGEVLRYAWDRTGVLSSTPASIYGFLKTRPELESPDVQYHVISASFDATGKSKLETEPGFTIMVNQCRPSSVGSIHIRSADPLAAPKIVTNFLSTELDRATMVGGVRLARRIMANPALDRIRVGEIGEGAAAQSDEAIVDYARRTAMTCYHYVGTCRMGEDPGAVVDSQLRVRGVEGLRVADASIMPRLVSGNTNAACLMIGEKAADLIKTAAQASLKVAAE